MLTQEQLRLSLRLTSSKRSQPENIGTSGHPFTLDFQRRSLWSGDAWAFVHLLTARSWAIIMQQGPLTFSLVCVTHYSRVTNEMTPEHLHQGPECPSRWWHRHRGVRKSTWGMAHCWLSVLSPVWGKYLNGFSCCSCNIVIWRMCSVLLWLQHFIASEIEYAHLGVPDVTKSKGTSTE